MIKFIGICLLIVSSVFAGGVLSINVKERIEELLYIKKLILMFRGELEYKNAMLSEAFMIVSTKAKSPYDTLFFELAIDTENNFTVSMSELFTKKINEILTNKTYLKKEDIQKLKELGDTLGFQNQKMQLSNIDLYIDRLTASINEEQDKMNDTIKVYRTLAIMMGMFLTIVLL